VALAGGYKLGWRMSSKDCLESVAQLRQAYGLDKIKSGLRQCLKCNTWFKSEDVKSQRLCCYCRMHTTDRYMLR